MEVGSAKLVEVERPKPDRCFGGLLSFAWGRESCCSASGSAKNKASLNLQAWR